MVRPCNDRRRLARNVRVRHQLGGIAPGFRRERIRVIFLRVKLVKPAGQALGAAPRIHKDQRGAMRHDVCIEVLGNKRPDGVRGGQRGVFFPAEFFPAVAAAFRPAGNADGIIDGELPDGRARLRRRKIRHILYRHAHIQVPLLVRFRRHDFHRAVAAQEIRDGRKRAHRG